MAQKRHNALDLFAGAGGLSLGFERAGFDIEYAVELDDYAALTYKNNHPNTITLHRSVQDAFDVITPKEFGEHFDVIFGGPPCQGFSLAGKRDPCDSRNSLWRWFMKFVQTLQPAIFVMENVPGILSMKHVPDSITPFDLKKVQTPLVELRRLKEIQTIRKSRKLDSPTLVEYNYLKLRRDSNRKVIDSILKPILPDIEQVAKLAGYTVKHKILRAVDYGTPQLRERFFMIGCRAEGCKLHIGFPEAQRLWRSAETVLVDLEEKLDGTIPNHVESATSPSVLEKIKKVKQGEAIYSYNAAGYRLVADQPAPTISGNHGTVLIHYKKDRFITQREMARLQDFPDSYRFYGPKTEVYKQIGNAVPVKLAEAVARSIRDALDGKNVPLLDKLMSTKNNKV